MKSFLRIIFLFTVALLFSCEGTKYLPNCSDCTADEPTEAVLRAEFDQKSSTGVILEIWEGQLEDNILIDSLRTYSTSYEKHVSLNRKYTVTATYIIDNKTYTAVSSTTPRVKYTADQCEAPCYYVYDQKVDLSLKYTK
jgi:hypothetical protein